MSPAIDADVAITTATAACSSIDGNDFSLRKFAPHADVYEIACIAIADEDGPKQMGVLIVNEKKNNVFTYTFATRLARDTCNEKKDCYKELHIINYQMIN